MQVYKAYFKIIRKRLPSILIYFSMFLLISLIITSVLGNTGTAAFTETRNKIAFFNAEPGSPIAEGLRQYLAESEDIVDIHDDTQSIQDALFYGNIVYALRVPEGFTESLMGGSNGVRLEKTAASGSASSVALDFLVDRYMNMTQIYSKNAPGITAAQIAANVKVDLAKEAEVTVNTYGNASGTDNLTYFFQYLAYSLISVMIMGVTSFMMAFNGKDLSDRNACSPMRPMSMNMQIVLGNATFALAAWAIQCAAVFLFSGHVALSAGTLLLILNALALTVASMSIGFLAGKFIRNSGVQSAVTNVVSLGTCFLSGVFVEQALLGKTVLDIARFTPGYWYVKSLEGIRNTVSYSFENILPVLYGMLIQLGFAAAIFILALVLSKQFKPQREI